MDGDDDDGYRSSEDEDYAPSEDDEAGPGQGRKRRRVLGGGGPARRGRGRAAPKRPRIGAAVVSDDDDEDLYAALQRPAAVPPPLEDAADGDDGDDGAAKPEADADIDALWADMNGGGAAAVSSSSAQPPRGGGGGEDEQEDDGEDEAEPAAKKSSAPADDLWAELQAETRGADERRPTDPALLEEAGKKPVKWWADVDEAKRESEGSSTVVVRKTVEYAGEKLEVTTAVERGSAEEKRLRAARELASSKSNLSGLLSEFGKSTKLSTIEKSRLDWERSKDDEGDAAELERFRKSGAGFVDKQRFLSDVDQRRFEIERAERNRVREQQKRKAASKTRNGAR